MYAIIGAEYSFVSTERLCTYKSAYQVENNFFYKLVSIICKILLHTGYNGELTDIN